jgi:hypothetical protein
MYEPFSHLNKGNIMKKELTKKEETTALTQMTASDDFGIENTESSDLIVPRLLLMHGQSQFVMDGLAGGGDLVVSGSGELLAKKGTLLDLVVFRMEKKTWVIKDMTENKARKVREEDYKIGDREDLEQEWEEQLEIEGKKQMRKLRRDFTYNFFAVRVDATDSLPLKLSFTRSSRQTGRFLADHFMKSQMLKKIPFANVISFGSDLIKDKKQPYYVFTGKVGREANESEVAAGRFWNDIIKKTRVVIHEDLDEVGATNAQTYQSTEAEEARF